MNISTPALRAGRRALAMGALTGAVFAAALALNADPAQAAFSAHVQAGTLTIRGDSASDRLALRLAAGSPNTLQVDVGDDGTADFSFDRTTFTAIDVEAGSGDDVVRIDQSGGTFTDEAVTLNGESGNDTLIGGDSADVLIGGSGDDFADGNRGSDIADLGSGNDVFQWDPGDGSDLVEGQSGQDRLAFNGANVSEQIDVSANGGRVRFFRDIANITMDLNGIEDIGFRALGGADKVTVNDLTGTDAKTVDVDLAASGGGGDGQPDTVIARGTEGPDNVSVGNADGATVVDGLAAQTRVTGGEEANDTIAVETLGGDDMVSTAVGVTSVPIHVDGGEGQDSARYDGSPADDQIQVVGNGTEATTFSPGSAQLVTNATVENLVVSGLDGNDTIAAGNGLATVTSLILSGGDGNDTLLGGDGADLLFGGKGDDFADGNRGSDQAFLGSNDDRFQWDPGDGSDLVEGGSGDDQLDFNGANISEHIDVSANGSRVLLTRDIASITMDLNELEQLNVRALGGSDQVTVGDLTGTGVKVVAVDLGATGGSGDGQADTVVVNGTDKKDDVSVTRSGSQVSVTGLAAETRIVGSEAANDTLRVQTGDGTDAVAVAPDVSDLIAPVVDLGADQ